MLLNLLLVLSLLLLLLLLHSSWLYNLLD